MPGWGDSDSDSDYTVEVEALGLEGGGGCSVDGTMLAGGRGREVEREWCRARLAQCLFIATSARSLLREWRAYVGSDVVHAEEGFTEGDAVLANTERALRATHEGFSVAPTPLSTALIAPLTALKESLSRVKKRFAQLGFWFPGNVGSSCRTQCNEHIVDIEVHLDVLEKACIAGHRIFDYDQDEVVEEGHGAAVETDTEVSWQRVLVGGRSMVGICECLLQWTAPPQGSEVHRATEAHALLQRCGEIVYKCKCAAMSVMHLAGISHRIPKPWVSSTHTARLVRRCEYVHASAQRVHELAQQAAKSPGGALIFMNDAARLCSALSESSLQAMKLSASLRA